MEAGFLEIVYGAGEEGAYLCSHPLVSAVHLTGSAATYDSIVWGKQPKVRHPITHRAAFQLSPLTEF